MQPVGFEIIKPEDRLGEGVRVIFSNGQVRIVSMIDAYLRYGFKADS